MIAYRYNAMNKNSFAQWHKKCSGGVGGPLNRTSCVTAHNANEGLYTDALSKTAATQIVGYVREAAL